MQNDFVDNKKKYLILENQKENLLQNKTVQSFNNAEELKKIFLMKTIRFLIIIAIKA